MDVSTVAASEPLSVYAILPFITIAALGLGFLVVFRQRAAARRALPPAAVSAPRPSRAGAPDRPWWGNPWLWVGVCAVSIVLGLFVWPGHEPRVDPRTNGHTTRDAGAFTGD